MSDSQLSASQLRQRYGANGTAQDSELSASQIRARHGVKNNSFQSDSSYGHVIAFVCVALMLIVGIVFVIKK